MEQGHGTVQEGAIWQSGGSTSRRDQANVQQCFEDMGGLLAFVEWAKKNQTAFYQLYSRLLPHEVDGEDRGGVTVVIQKLSDSAEG